MHPQGDQSTVKLKGVAELGPSQQGPAFAILPSLPRHPHCSPDPLSKSFSSLVPQSTALMLPSNGPLCLRQETKNLIHSAKIYRDLQRFSCKALPHVLGCLATLTPPVFFSARAHPLTLQNTGGKCQILPSIFLQLGHKQVTKILVNKREGLLEEAGDGLWEIFSYWSGQKEVPRTTGRCQVYTTMIATEGQLWRQKNHGPCDTDEALIQPLLLLCFWTFTKSGY